MALTTAFIRSSLLSLLFTPFMVFATPSIDMDSALPADRQAIILKTLANVTTLAGELRQPAKIAFRKAQKTDFYEGAVTDIEKDTIILTKLALDLSPAAFEAVIAHEITHLIVAANFHIPGEAPSSEKRLIDHIKASKSSMDYSNAVLAMAHTPYAELLCDLMAVIATRNPKAISEMMTEIKNLAALDPELEKRIAVSFKDQPNDLSWRDFTLSHNDPRWAAYTPSDFNYNRFNQIRAYLGERWLHELPIEKHPALFANTLSLLDQVYLTQQLEYVVSTQGLVTANKMLIEFLEQKLSEKMPK